MSDTILLQQIHDRVMAIDSKLDAKSDKDDCDRIDDRVIKLEEKTSSMVAKQAGMAGVASGLMLAIKQMLSGDL